jgi:hypothetical protein
MVADFDVIDFLHILADRSVRLLPASAAGVLLTDPRGELRVAAASSDAAGMLELFQVHNDQGPCMDCLRTAQAVTAADLAGPDQRWPRFASAAVNAGFRTVQALPMRLRDEVIGALNLFGAETAAFNPEDLRIGQALADVATIGLLQQRNRRTREQHAGQLQSAPSSRVIIEQAKGKLAERLSIDIDMPSRFCATTPATATSGSPTSPATSSTAPPPTSPRQPVTGAAATSTNLHPSTGTRYHADVYSTSRMNPSTATCRSAASRRIDPGHGQPSASLAAGQTRLQSRWPGH